MENMKDMPVEEVATEETAAPANKVVYSYTITRFENGNTEVDNVERDDTVKLSLDEIFTDITNVAEQVKNRREEEKMRRAVAMGISEYMVAVENQRRAAELEAQSAAAEMPQ